MIGPAPAPHTGQKPTVIRKVEQRGAMLRAAFDLARRGGYDAVQMREVADAVGMSPGSVYNYFESKDHLLSALMIDWSRDLYAEVRGRIPQRGTVAERLAEIFEHVGASLQEQPRLTEAMLVAVRHHTQASDDTRYKETVYDLLASTLRSVFPPSIRCEDGDEIVRILCHVWYALLMGWSAGWASPTQVQAEIGLAVRRLTASIDGSAAPRAR